MDYAKFGGIVISPHFLRWSVDLNQHIRKTGYGVPQGQAENNRAKTFCAVNQEMSGDWIIYGYCYLLTAYERNNDQFWEVHVVPYL